MFPVLQGLQIDIQQYIPALLDTAVTILTFLIVFVVVYRVGRSVASRAVDNTLRQREFDETLISFALTLTVVVTTVFALAIAATVAGFGTALAAFATLGGAITLAIGFATQDLVANFVAGVFIVRDKPFIAGDWIEWEGNEGMVREIRLRVTKLETFDNEVVTVPNGKLANAVVINNVANDQRRVSVDFGIGYNNDIDLARSAIVEEGTRLDGVLVDPEPTAPVTELGDSAVVLSGRIWIDPSQSSYGDVRTQFVEAVKKRFDAEGIDIPYHNTKVSGNIEVRNGPSA